MLVAKILKMTDQSRWKEAPGVCNWNNCGKRPARMLLVNTRFTNQKEQVAEDLIRALENVLAVICHLAGPSKMPLFGLYGLGRHPEMLLPLTHLKSNYPRVQSALQELKGCIGSPLSRQDEGCIALGIQEACGQFRRQVQQNNRGLPGFCQQLEIILLTTQPRDVVQRQVEDAGRRLNTQYLTKIQVEIIETGVEGELPVQDDVSSQGSSVTSGDSPLSGILELFTLEASPLSFQKFFSSWLLECNTDMEHINLVLPPSEDDEAELVIKCDLHERIINPANLPFQEQFIIQDGPLTKSIATSNNRTDTAQRVSRMVARSLLNTSAICESIVFGLPMVVQPTTCWRMDWDELERHQQNLKSLCLHLLDKELAILAQLGNIQNDSSSRTTVRSHLTKANNDVKPSGYFLLLPSLNGTMLLKSIAAAELVLPCKQSIDMLDPCPSFSVECISKSLSALDVSDSFNPFEWHSGLFESLKSKGASTPTSQKATKRKGHSTFDPPSLKDF